MFECKLATIAVSALLVGCNWTVIVPTDGALDAGNPRDTAATDIPDAHDASAPCPENSACPGGVCRAGVCVPCGSTGQACCPGVSPCSTSGATCVAGACECPGGQSACSGQCRELTFDRANCGACGVTCPPGAICVSGHCTCPTGFALCDALCVHAGAEVCDGEDNDCSHLVDDGASSAGGEVCSAGSCVCPTGMTCSCATPPPTGPFEAILVAGTPGGARDLTFNGVDAFAIGATTIIRVDSSGAGTPFPGSTLNLTGRGLRYLPNGDIAVVTTGQALRVYSPTTSTVSTVGSGYSYLNGLAVHPNGSIYFTDTALSGATPMVRRASSEMPGAAITSLTSAIPVPTGLAFSADYRRLYVGSAGHGVYFLNLAADGTTTDSPHMYLSEPVNAYGLAFDECGNLYVSDADRGRIVRVPPGGGSFQSLSLTLPGGGSPVPVGLAFGQTPFDRTSLYFVDLSQAAVFRVPVGVAGGPIVLPH